MPEPAEKTVSILILDDHALFRESVARLLAAEPGFEVTAHSGSIEEALITLRQTHIDIVLLDFDLGQRDGTEFMRLARQQGSNARVLVVTAGVDESKIAELIQTGVSGIFMKHNSAASLPQGIRDVMAGKVWFDQEMLQGAPFREAGNLVRIRDLPNANNRFFPSCLKAWRIRRSRRRSASPKAR